MKKIIGLAVFIAVIGAGSAVLLKRDSLVLSPGEKLSLRDAPNYGVAECNKLSGEEQISCFNRLLEHATVTPDLRMRGQAPDYLGCPTTITEPGRTEEILYRESDARKISRAVPADDVCLYEMRSQSAYRLNLFFQSTAGREMRSAYLFGGGKKPPVFVYKSLGGQPVEAIAKSGIGLVRGSDFEKKGVYGFFRIVENSPVDGSAVGIKKKSANCLGAIAWWGMSEPDALKSCQEGQVAAN